MSDSLQSIVRSHMKVFQEQLPITESPFTEYAKQLGISEDEVIALLQKYLANGTIRRVAGLLKHNKAGFTTNAMVALEIAPEQCDEAGAALSQFTFITHCYKRTAYPDWPYTMYAMVHAKNKEEFDGYLERIRTAVDCKSIRVLRSLKEYKKTAFRIPPD